MIVKENIEFKRGQNTASALNVGHFKDLILRDNIKVVFPLQTTGREFDPATNYLTIHDANGELLFSIPVDPDDAPTYMNMSRDDAEKVINAMVDTLNKALGY